MDKKLISGRLQDIEANLKLLETEGKIGYFFHKAGLPFVWRYSKEQWIKILKFERKQELERLIFFKELNSTEGTK